MKILYLMTEPFGYGGVQSDILALSEDLTARQHEVYVATMEGELLHELLHVYDRGVLCMAPTRRRAQEPHAWKHV